MSSPSQGAWECRHGVDGRDWCEECHAPASDAATTPEAWYHADFCHAFAWVYEDGDKLRVRWAERTGSDLYLHSKSDCDRCREIRKDEHAARDGEFTMEKPPEEFSSAASFFHVLAEIGKYVPGLLDEEANDAADD